jgi:hypothetical protein
VSPEDPIVGAERFGNTNWNCFLPNREVTRAANLAGVNHLADVILSGANEEHPPKRSHKPGSILLR